jgi:hypothetical protein
MKTRQGMLQTEGNRQLFHLTFTSVFEDGLHERYENITF